MAVERSGWISAGFRFYSPELESQAAGHLAARTRLKRAIELGQLELHYQPQVAVADQRLVGLEALIRWRTEDGALISPTDFIPVAEETGLIVPLGDWVLRRACVGGQTLARAGFGDIAVAVNLSGRQFRREQLAKERPKRNWRYSRSWAAMNTRAICTVDPDPCRN